MKKIRLILLLIVLFIANIYLHAQAVDINAPIDIDPNVKIGKLANGLTYYIRNNHKPENRVYMWLAVKTGSCNEDDNQQGLAHFTEHMGFEGSAHFNKKELVDYLEKIGVKFGADLNAETTFDKTVYKLQLPSDNKEIVDKGFFVLEDWAHNLAFNDSLIEKERNVITEEWRLGLGAQDRMRKQYLPVMLKGSRYAERLPIGKMDIVQKCKHETLKKYYHDWYRPDLIAVVIVGDIDVNLAEQKIKEHFDSMKNPDNERPSVDFDIPDNQDPLISICTDKEATNSVVQFYFKHAKLQQKLIKDYRKYLLYNLFTSMLNERFDEITQKPDSPFIYAGSGYGSFLAKTKDAYTLSSAAKENQINKTIETVIVENERVKKFGFTQTELDRAKDNFLSWYSTAEKEADKTESQSFVNEYIENFLSNEPIPGIKNELKYVKDMLPKITLTEIDKLIDKMITDENEAIVITAPDKDGIKVPKESEVLDIIKSAKAEDISIYIDKVSDSPLIEGSPTGSKIVSAKENKDFGYTELTFANGVKAVLKPTDFKNDEILFSAYSLGGTSLYPDKDICSATYASIVVNECGISKFDKTELGKKLSGKIVSVSPYITDLRQGFKGSVAPKDLETLLQLTYLYFKKPRKDNEAFQAFISNSKEQIKSMSANPQYVWIDTLSKIITMNSPRTVIPQIPSVKQLDKVNLDDAFNIYKDRFADAGDFKFFFTGNFKVDEIKPLLETYLGGLPSINRKETWKNVEPKFPDGITEVTVHKGVEPQSFVAIVMKEKFDWNYKNIIINRVMMEILQISLRERTRDEKSEVYAVQVNGEEEIFPEPSHTATFIWGCAPANTDELIALTFKEIKNLQKKGPSKTDLDKVKENLNRDRETEIKKNEYWLIKLENLYYEDVKLNTLDEYRKIVNSVTSEDIEKAAQKYLPAEHYVKVLLMPEAKK